jgi:hypothetical protein
MSSKKKRECPALNEIIRRERCGTERNSLISCPASCDFNSYGSERYDEFLAIEKKLDDLLFERVMESLSPEEIRSLPIGDLDEANSYELNACIIWHLFFKQHADGKSLAEQWLEDTSHPFSNDERVLIAAQLSSRPALLEVQEVLDGQSFRAKDLLDPESGVLTFYDRSSAQRLLPFEHFFTFVYQAPCYYRLKGGGLYWRTSNGETALGTMQKAAGQAGIFLDRGGLQSALAEGFGKICREYLKLSQESAQAFKESLDITQSLLTYHVLPAVQNLEKDLAECGAFREEPEVQQEYRAKGMTRSWEWMAIDDCSDYTPPAVIQMHTFFKGNQVPLIGRLMIGKTDVLIEAFSRAASDYARNWIEKKFSRKLQFKQSFVKDLNHGLDKERAGEKPPFPGISRTDENRFKTRYMEEHFRKITDEKIPMLKNLTPREAASRPEMRESVLEWVKIHLSGAAKESAEMGSPINVMPLIQACGLKELESIAVAITAGAYCGQDLSSYHPGEERTTLTGSWMMRQPGVEDYLSSITEGQIPDAIWQELMDYVDWKGGEFEKIHGTIPALDEDRLWDYYAKAVEPLFVKKNAEKLFDWIEGGTYPEWCLDYMEQTDFDHVKAKLRVHYIVACLYLGCLSRCIDNALKGRPVDYLE